MGRGLSLRREDAGEEREKGRETEGTATGTEGETRAVAEKAPGTEDATGGIKFRKRKERLLSTVAENVKPGNSGSSSGKKTFVTPPGENRQDIPRSTKVPMDKRFIGAVGAYRQLRKVKVTNLSPNG